MKNHQQQPNNLKQAQLKLVVPKAALVESHPEKLHEPEWKDYFQHRDALDLDPVLHDDLLIEAKIKHDLDMAAFKSAKERMAKPSNQPSAVNDDLANPTDNNQLHPGLMLDMFAKPIVINPAFASITHSALASLFLSYLAYESEDLAPEYEGWVHRTTDEWTEWTGMSRFEQTSARKVLTGLGITEETRAGMPAKLFIRINFEHLYALLNAQAQQRYAHMKL